MNAREFRKVGKYVGELAQMYGLSDWKLVLHEGTDDDEHAAEVVCVYGRKLAHINLSSDFLTWESRQQTHAILHELTHIHWDQTWTLLTDTLPRFMGAPAADAFLAGYRQMMEHATDAIADGIADRFPVYEP